MSSPARLQRRYDHRLHELVCNAKDVDVAVRHGVPRSTGRGWLAPTTTPVVTLNALNQDAVGLQREVVALRQRVDRLVALLRLMALLLKLTGASLCRVAAIASHPSLATAATSRASCQTRSRRPTSTFDRESGRPLPEL